MSHLSISSLLLLGFFTATIATIGAVEVSQYSKFSLGSYKGYGSMYLVKFRVRIMTSAISWIFISTKNHKQCETKNILIFIQHSGYPIAKMTNRTFPPSFVTSRENSYRVSNFTDDSAMTLAIREPTPGDWYLAVTLPRATGIIRQQGMGLSCNYELGTTLMTVPSSYTPHTLSAGVPYNTTLKRRETALFRIYLNDVTWMVTVLLDDCTPDSCNVTLATKSGSAPTSVTNDGSVTCMSAGCSVSVMSPRVSSWFYMTVTNIGQSSVEIVLDVTLSECSPVTVADNFSCHVTRQLDPERHLTSQNVQFGSFVDGKFETTKVVVTGGVDLVIPFYLMTLEDMGGTLKFMVAVINKTEPPCHTNFTVCLQHARIHRPNTTFPCMAELTVNVTDPDPAKLYIPYPQSGHWFVTLSHVCHHPDKCCDDLAVSVDISSHPCVEGQCSNRGHCNYYRAGSFGLYSSCSCIVGYEGYDCTDDTHVPSRARQLLDILLLTLSNLFFLPAIVIAVRRKFYPEAIVYLANMAFSSLYHACDVQNLFTYCVAPRNILSYSDFFCSILSLWVTVVAVNEHGNPWQSMLHMGGVVFLQFGVSYARHSLWVFLTPSVIGVAIVVLTWMWRCKTLRKCYPRERRYWATFIPGIVCALIGVCIFSFVETESNYMYTHSVWHMLMATSIALVLPKKPPWIETTRGITNELGSAETVEYLLASQDTSTTANRHNEIL